MQIHACTLELKQTFQLTFWITGEESSTLWVLLNTQIDSSLFPLNSILHPMNWNPIKLTHLEGHLNSLTAPRGDEE